MGSIQQPEDDLGNYTVPLYKALIVVKISLTYQGNLRTEAVHGPSGQTLNTDAPKDNHGLGANFSPTDLVATALGSCVVTVMGIVAKRHDIDLEGTKVSVTKEMTNTPIRKIARLEVTLNMPSGIPLDKRTLLEKAAHTCPVCKSLGDDVARPITLNYPD